MEQIETQFAGGASVLALARYRGGGRQTGTHALMSSPLASAQIEISRLITPKVCLSSCVWLISANAGRFWLML